MDDLSEKHAAFVKKLYEQTIRQKIDWEIDSFSENLEASVGKYRVRLFERRDQEDTPYEVVIISSQAGDELERFDDGDLRGSPEIEGFSDYWRLMSSLRQRALRQARKVDIVLDDLLKSLDDEDSDEL